MTGSLLYFRGWRSAVIVFRVAAVIVSTVIIRLSLVVLVAVIIALSLVVPVAVIVGLSLVILVAVIVGLSVVAAAVVIIIDWGSVSDIAVVILTGCIIVLQVCITHVLLGYILPYIRVGIICVVEINVSVVSVSERSPSVVAVATAPCNPGGAPVAARYPVPAVGSRVLPAPIVEWRPAP